jgi:hypothetical protein
MHIRRGTDTEESGDMLEWIGWVRWDSRMARLPTRAGHTVIRDGSTPRGRAEKVNSVESVLHGQLDQSENGMGRR